MTTVAPPLRVLDHHMLAWRRLWRGTVFSSFLTPLLFLGAMGYGLGALLAQQGRHIEGVAYVAFVAPGVLAASAMQTGVGESTWSVLSGIKWQRTYHAMLATPLGPGDIVLGHLAHLAIRLTLQASVFLAVAGVLGALPSWWAVVALPAAVLTGLAHAAPVFSFTTTQHNDTGFNLLFRFAVTPMFLFSGTFFPISQLPGWLQVVAHVTPLWHGVQVCRDATLGRLGPVDLWHAAYLLLWLGVGLVLARYGLRRRMVV